jgi:hypothetical protein
MISSRSLTTREDDKGIYINENPFNTHPWFLNLVRKLCTSLPPSACDYRRKHFNSKFSFIFYILDGAHRLINQTEYRLIKENV